MMLSEVLGQSRVVRSLSRALASDRIHHALLFIGPRGVGKRTTAEALAHRLLCSAPHGTDPCRQCGACTRFSTGNHADFIMIGARKDSSGGYEKSIKIDEVRTLQTKLNLKPFEGGRRVVLIHNAERMNPATANALLKTLEEPSPDTYFVLTTQNHNALLPTIVSRCQSLKFAELTTDTLRKIVEANGRDASVNEDALNAANGSAARLLEMTEEASAQIFSEMRTRLQSVDSWGIHSMIEFAEADSSDKSRQRMHRVLDALQANYLERYKKLMTAGAERSIGLNGQAGRVRRLLEKIEAVRYQLSGSQRNARQLMEEVWCQTYELEKTQ